jgi:predicted Zn-dependent peptidase
MQPGKVARLLDRTFAFPVRGRRPRWKREKFDGAVSKKARRSGWSQYHVVAGSRTVPADHPDRFAVMLLSGIIGGGVSSRLFQSMREKAGLAYSVYSHVNFWRDTGALSLYFCVDPRNLRPALSIFEWEVEGLRSGGVTAAELDSAKAQLKGSIIFSLESSETRLFRLLHEECYLGDFRAPEDVMSDIDSVSTEDIHRVAAEYLSPGGMIRAVCGPPARRRTEGNGGR